MMTPKDRVKLNVYKSLLEEEKKKNKKLVVMGASLFVMGVFSDGVYEVAMKKVSPQPVQVAILESEVMTPEMLTTTSTNEVAWESFFEDEIVQEKKVDLSTDDLFVVDYGI